MTTLQFKKFVIKKYVALIQDDGGQEYPVNDQPDPEDIKEEADSVTNVYADGDFLMGYLIEYWLLKNSPGELSACLKKQRIPKAKTYEKELLQFFKASQE